MHDRGLLDDGIHARLLDFPVAEEQADVGHGVAAQVREAEVKRHAVLLVLDQLLRELHLQVGTLELGALAVGTETSVEHAVLGLLKAVVVAWRGHFARLLARLIDVQVQVWVGLGRPTPIHAEVLHHAVGTEILFLALFGVDELLKIRVRNEVLGGNTQGEQTANGHPRDASNRRGH